MTNEKTIAKINSYIKALNDGKWHDYQNVQENAGTFKTNANIATRKGMDEVAAAFENASKVMKEYRNTEENIVEMLNAIEKAISIKQLNTKAARRVLCSIFAENMIDYDGEKYEFYNDEIANRVDAIFNAVKAYKK